MPRRFSAPFCFLLMSSMTAWRSDFAASWPRLGIPRFGDGSRRESYGRVYGVRGRYRRSRPTASSAAPAVRRTPPIRTAAVGSQPARPECRQPHGLGERHGQLGRGTGAPNGAASPGSPRERAHARPRGRRSRTGRRPPARTSAAAPGPSSPGGQHQVGAAADHRERAAAELALASSASAGELVGDGGRGHRQRVAVGVDAAGVGRRATRSPAAPIAMSVWPSRQARPAVSVTTTPTLRPVRLGERGAEPAAEASGSIGQQHDASRPRRWRRRRRPRPGSARAWCARSWSGRAGRPPARSRRASASSRSPGRRPGPRPC